MSGKVFSVGDIVVLRCGGPKMTVTDVSISEPPDKQRIWCIWVDASNSLSKGVFPSDTCVLAEEQTA